MDKILPNLDGSPKLLLNFFLFLCSILTSHPIDQGRMPTIGQVCSVCTLMAELRMKVIYDVITLRSSLSKFNPMRLTSASSQCMPQPTRKWVMKCADNTYPSITLDNAKNITSTE